MKNEKFGRMLKAMISGIAYSEGKTNPAIERDLGAQIGLSGASIQRYKAGHIPPETHTVEILAEAAVKRGYLNREWLQNFLSAAYYPSPEKLLDRLCPAAPVRPRPPRVYENLPAPTYTQFVMRKEPYEEVLDGLHQRSAVVLISSLGGMGKTSLAREVAVRCVQGDSDAPKFDAVVWVSDKDRPGTTTLSIVLDEIARTLDYPGFTQFEHEQKQREVEQLLRRQRVLLVVDNFETITDGALLSWLLRLPEPSKAVVTTREYRREFRRGTWPIELRGMSDAEANEFILQRLRMLRIDKMVSDMSQLTPLIVATGGNPKALEMTLGYIKYQHQPLQQVMDDLYEARGDLFNDLFSRAWSLLDQTAQHVLLSMALFPSSADGEALAVMADVRGFAFDQSIEQLADLALLDIHQINLNSVPRYALHPLVRAFAGAKLHEAVEFERGGRERWIKYYRSFANQFERDDWDIPRQLDRVEMEMENLHAVIDYCHSIGAWDILIEMVLILRSFWGTRGYYEVRDRLVELAIRAAEARSDVAAHIRLLCSKAGAMYYRNDAQSAMAFCEHARSLLSSFDSPDPLLVVSVNNAQIRVCRMRGDFEKMLALAQHNVSICEAQHWTWHVLQRYYIAEYLYRVSKYDEAEQMFQRLIEASESLGYRREPIKGWLYLAQIALRSGRLDLAEQRLQRADDLAQILQHRRFLTDVKRIAARLHELRGNILAARNALVESIGLAERLGLFWALSEARTELARLETSVALEPAIAPTE